MRSTPQRLGIRTHAALVALLSLWAAGAAGAQAIRETARSQSESGLILTVEAFCSETRLRTANVRVRWSLTPGARAGGVTTVAGAKATLDTTVFNEGFEKGLYVSVPVPATTPPKPVPPVSQAGVQTRQAPLRAYQFQLVEVTQPRAAAAPGESGEVTAVIEDVEPGMNYTWRVTIETPSGKTVSAPVSLQAPTCPADLIEPVPQPRRRP